MTKEEYRKAYSLKFEALSIPEQKLIKKAFNIFYESINNYKLTTSEQDATLQLDSKITESVKSEITEAFIQEKISLEKVLKIADRVLSGKWYVIQIDSFIEEKEYFQHFLSTSDGRDEVLPIEKYPKYYEIENDTLMCFSCTVKDGEVIRENPSYPIDEILRRIREQLDSIGITPDYKALSFNEWLTLRNIQILFKKSDETNTTSLIPIKSDPIFVPFSLGRSEIEGMTKTKTKLNIRYKDSRIVSIVKNEHLLFLERNIFAQKMLDLINAELYATGYSTNKIKIKISDIMELQNVSSRANMYEQLKKFAEISDSSLLTAETKNGFQNVNITHDSSITDGYYVSSIGDNFFQYMKECSAKELYPQRMQLLSNKTSSYSFCREFVDNRKQQNGKQSQNRLRVSTLIKKSKLPTDVPSGHEYAKIMSKFRDSMDECVDTNIFKEWHFCHSGGNLLTDEEKERLSIDKASGKHDYELFLKLLVEVTWSDDSEPDYSHLKKAKDKREERLQNAKAKIVAKQQFKEEKKTKP